MDESGIASHVREEAARTLAAYRAQPNLVREHVGIEDEVLSGGYGHRQIHELIQNAADAILEGKRSGQVQLVLTKDALYCANEGAAIDLEGVDAILNSHMSRKRGSQIGQFGIGFKSVLALSTSPELHGRSGGFAFDAQWSEALIRGVVPGAERTPVLRVARPLGDSETVADDQLTQLMSWATTTVKLPRNVEGTDWVSRDFESFPKEFLLFSPHINCLVLNDRVTGRVREISISREGSHIRVSESGDSSLWWVFSTEIVVRELSQQALLDADRKTRERATLPLLWAVPSDRRRVRGQFWAFFPTETETTLSGILNAPWKTNADRQNLLDGPFNRALLREATRLVRQSLAGLYSDRDPGYVLDVLPARVADAAGWADKALVEILEPALAAVECVPDVHGILQLPSELYLRPEALMGTVKDETISDNSFILPTGWVHETVERRERRAKAERIGVTKADLKRWLEALAHPGTPIASARAIKAAGLIRKEIPQSQTASLRRAEIVLTASGALVAADHPGLYMDLGNNVNTPNGIAVHHLVCSEADVAEVLRLLNVREQSALARLDALLVTRDVDWSVVWPELRKVSPAEATEILVKHSDQHSLHARTLRGSFEPIEKTLLPGAIVPVSGIRDTAICVDMEFHASDLQLLGAFGVTDTPTSKVKLEHADWFAAYLSAARSAYVEGLPHGARRPSPDYLSFEKTETLGPLDPLASLSDEGRIEMTRLLLPHLHGEGEWILRHLTQPASFPTLSFTPPIRWMVERFGRVPTSLGPQKVCDAVSPRLEQWESLVAVVRLGEVQAEILRLPERLDDLSNQQWKAAFGRARYAPESIVGRFYVHAARILSPPALLWCSEGDQMVQRPPCSVHVAYDVETAHAHRLERVPSIIVPDRDGLNVLVTKWGMQKPAGTVRFIAAGDEGPLADALPGLRAYLPETVWANPIQQCVELWFEPASNPSASTQLSFARVGDRLCFIGAMQRVDLIQRIAAEFGVQLSEDQIRDASEYLGRGDRRRLVDAVREIGDIVGKVAALIETSELFDGLPFGVQEILVERGKDSSDRDVAQMALAVHGVDILRQHTDSLEKRGLEPPTRWSGSARAQEFVDEIGFPLEYAGFKRARRDPTWDVDGPTDLKPLHEFQQTIGSRIKTFLAKPIPERGLLSLPTGSGKTRVVVQAMVESIRHGDLSGTLVWVAQSDELCEQAVQSWAEIWRALGPRRRLRISRLWGQTNNRIVAADSPHVVVTTYQTLITRLRSPSFDWLVNASCVIIDEAHGSIAPSYTDILERFGLTVRETARPLIGVTATPFRSASDPGETQWLVNRYGRQRFDHGVIEGDDPYPVLQDMRILARVDHQLLEGDDLTLSTSELAELTQFKRLPASAELRLGASGPRNQRLIASITSLPADWPVLLFATSVEHASLMAALLSIEGVSAKAISGETDAGSRRHYVEEFRQGRLRVLCNYSVLSTGFDAPALRALYIARPVYSPVLYQQMLGRGLRGPLNGGKDRCLVVNVQDNVAQFGEQLAFRHFEYLW